ncbi:MAG: glycosyltransferase family A protein [Candidatus Bathyarchaeia archaeon]|jgi:hypothetical protein
MNVPVVLFAFNRPDTTQLVLDALREQTTRPDLLIVFADGPRNIAEESEVNLVRGIVRAVNWTEVQLVERSRNIGCAANITRGLIEVFKSYSRAVVLEDDVFPAKHFYESMCTLLAHYDRVRQVFSVGGYPSLKPNSLRGYAYDVVLSPRFSCWGWGTWADRWETVASDLLDFRSPFPSPDDVPLFAGDDISGAVLLTKARPGFYWDLPIALLSLYHSWLHALTRYYLTNNIGISSGVHGSAGPHTQRFIKQNNPLTEKCPLLFPPARRLDDVCAAIQQYIKDIRKADVKDRQSIRSIPGRLWKHMLAKTETT